MVMDEEDKKLIEAAKTGDAAYLRAHIKDFLDDTPDPKVSDIKDDRGFNLLDLAYEGKHAEAVLELIVKKGARISIATLERQEPGKWKSDPDGSELTIAVRTIEIFAEAGLDFKFVGGKPASWMAALGNILSKDGVEQFSRDYSQSPLNETFVNFLKVGAAPFAKLIKENAELERLHLKGFNGGHCYVLMKHLADPTAQGFAGRVSKRLKLAEAITKASEDMAHGGDISQFRK